MHLHNEGISARTAMALHHLWRVLHYGRDSCEHIAHNRHANERSDGHSNFHWVNIGVVPNDDAGFFHTLNALHHSRSSKANAASQLGIREPSINLQFLEQLPADLVEQ